MGKEVVGSRDANFSAIDVRQADCHDAVLVLDYVPTSM
jgi:hypothetical protein